MQIYDCIVRLAGDITNEVPKTDATAAEIIVLRHIHGGDAVIGIKKRHMDKRPHSVERDRLSLRYGFGITEHLFGATHNKLPVELNKDTEEQFAKQIEADEHRKALEEQAFGERVDAAVQERLDDMGLGPDKVDETKPDAPDEE